MTQKPVKDENSRRNFLKKGAMITLAGITAGGLNDAFAISDSGTISPPVKFELTPLPYPANALEPYIDTMTMEIHHDKHHLAYITNLNKAIEGMSEVPALEEMFKNMAKYSMAIRNHGGGHFNHSMFWKGMKANGSGQPSGVLNEAINSSFGSFENFKSQYTEAAMKHFGSGWAWLVMRDGKLEIGTTPNQDNPLMDISTMKGTPILGLDVWEHAYYLKYQNRRAEYITGWWNVVNWDEIGKNFHKSK